MIHTIHEKVERNKKVFEYVKQGLSYNQIAKEMNMTFQNVARIIKTHQDKYLTLSEQNKYLYKPEN